MSIKLEEFGKKFVKVAQFQDKVSKDGFQFSLLNNIHKSMTKKWENFHEINTDQYNLDQNKTPPKTIILFTFTTWMELHAYSKCAK